MATEPQEDIVTEPSPEEEKNARFLFPLIPLAGAPLLLLAASLLRHSHYAGFNGPKVVQYGPGFSFFQFAGVALYFYLAYAAFKKDLSGWGWMFGSLAVAFNPFPAFSTGIVGDSTAWGLAVVVAIIVMVKALIDRE